MEKLNKYDSSCLLKYLAIGLGASIVVGTFGSIFSRLFSRYKSSKNNIKKEQNLKAMTLKENLKKEPDLSVDRAVEIMALINEIADNKVKISLKDMEEKRRNNIHDKDEYERQCKEIFDIKEYIFSKTTEKILKETEFSSMEDIQNILKQHHPHEIEKKAYKYYHPSFENKDEPDMETIKEAFLYYGKKFKKEIVEIDNLLKKQDGYEVELTNVIFFKLLVLKTRVEDRLYIKYDLTEAELRYLLFKYNLFDKDEEIKKLNLEISKFDDMFYDNDNE
jgi:hypothetical protein